MKDTPEITIAQACEVLMKQLHFRKDPYGSSAGLALVAIRYALSNQLDRFDTLVSIIQAKAKSSPHSFERHTVFEQEVIEAIQKDAQELPLQERERDYLEIREILRLISAEQTKQPELGTGRYLFPPPTSKYLSSNSTLSELSQAGSLILVMVPSQRDLHSFFLGLKQCHRETPISLNLVIRGPAGMEGLPHPVHHKVVVFHTDKVNETEASAQNSTVDRWRLIDFDGVPSANASASFGEPYSFLGPYYEELDEFSTIAESKLFPVQDYPVALGMSLDTELVPGERSVFHCLKQSSHITAMLSPVTGISSYVTAIEKNHTQYEEWRLMDSVYSDLFAWAVYLGNKEAIHDFHFYLHNPAYRVNMILSPEQYLASFGSEFFSWGEQEHLRRMPKNEQLLLSKLLSRFHNAGFFLSESGLEDRTKLISLTVQQVTPLLRVADLLHREGLLKLVNVPWLIRSRQVLTQLAKGLQLLDRPGRHTKTLLTAAHCQRLIGQDAPLKLAKEIIKERDEQEFVPLDGLHGLKGDAHTGAQIEHSTSSSEFSSQVSSSSLAQTGSVPIYTAPNMTGEELLATSESMSEGPLTTQKLTVPNVTTVDRSKLSFIPKSVFKLTHEEISTIYDTTAPYGTSDAVFDTSSAPGCAAHITREGDSTTEDVIVPNGIALTLSDVSSTSEAVFNPAEVALNTTNAEVSTIYDTTAPYGTSDAVFDTSSAPGFAAHITREGGSTIEDPIVPNGTALTPSDVNSTSEAGLNIMDGEVSILENPTEENSTERSVLIMMSSGASRMGSWLSSLRSIVTGWNKGGQVSSRGHTVHAANPFLRLEGARPATGVGGRPEGLSRNEAPLRLGPPCSSAEPEARPQIPVCPFDTNGFLMLLRYPVHYIGRNSAGRSVPNRIEPLEETQGDIVASHSAGQIAECLRAIWSRRVEHDVCDKIDALCVQGLKRSISTAQILSSTDEILDTHVRGQKLTLAKREQFRREVFRILPGVQSSPVQHSNIVTCPERRSTRGHGDRAQRMQLSHFFPTRFSEPPNTTQAIRTNIRPRTTLGLCRSSS